jgi:hypothetical protein
MVAPSLNGAPKRFCKKAGVCVRFEGKSVISGHGGKINPLNYWHKKLTRGIGD